MKRRVVEVSEFNGKNWFARAGNFHSEGLRLTERFTQMSPDAIWYEATVTDPQTFTEPWTLAMPIYRRLEANATVLDYPCIEFAEEFMYCLLYTSDAAAERSSVDIGGRRIIK